MTPVVTTFSKDGYELYGKRMIETWLAYWPKSEYQLVVYVEDFELDEKDHGIIQRDIYECCPALIDFKKTSIEMIAKSPNDGKYEKRIQKTVKWSHKVFAIDHALRNSDTDYLIYLDGDTHSFDGAPVDLAQTLCGDNLAAVHFERLIHGLHFETGLIIFNRKHERFKEFLDVYVKGYETFEIYDMKKTWDSYWLVHLYKEYDFPIGNLGTKSSKVFNNPIIKKFLKHDVGPDKYINANYGRYTGRKK
jgi:hypothetical protein